MKPVSEDMTRRLAQVGQNNMSDVRTAMGKKKNNAFLVGMGQDRRQMPSFVRVLQNAYGLSQTSIIPLRAMPPAQVSELRSMLQVFLDITEKRPGALSPRAALAKLQSALACGHLFSGFPQGPPQWIPGLKPLRLDRSATELACHELNLYGLLCAEVGAVEKYSPTSSLWNSLYAVQPVILQWMEFLHPMNKNIRLKDDALYSHGVGVTLISLFGGLSAPRHGDAAAS